VRVQLAGRANAVLKAVPRAHLGHLDETLRAQRVAEHMRRRGYPTPAWLGVGATATHVWHLTDFVDAAPVARTRPPRHQAPIKCAVLPVNFCHRVNFSPDVKKRRPRRLLFSRYEMFTGKSGGAARPAHGWVRTSPRTGVEKATDGAYSDLPFQDACSMSPSRSSRGSSSASPVPRASAMRWLAASDRPSMQWASIFSRIATPRPTRRSAPPGLRQVRVGGQEDLLTDIALDISTAGQEPVQRGAASTRRPRAARAVSGGRRGYPPSAGPLFMTMRRASRA